MMGSKKTANTSVSATGAGQMSELKAAVVVDAFSDDPNGLIPTEFLYHPIKIELQQIWRFPAQYGETDNVHFSIKPHTPEPAYPLPPIPLLGPVTEDDFPVELSIGGNWLKISGSYDLSYYVDGPGGIEHSPHVTTFTLDWMPPGGMAPLMPPMFIDPEVANNGITEAYISEHEFVELRIPTYLDRQAFDDGLIFLLETEESNPFLAAYTHTFVSTTEALIVPVPSGLFRQLPNGPRFLRYGLRDRAGNQQSNYSGATPVYINLQALPSGLQPPEVLAYDYDGLIDRADARSGVNVRFGAYFDWNPTDEVAVSWNGILLAREPVDGFPKVVPVSWSVLIQNGYLQTQVPVRYFIYRAGVATAVPSPVRRVDADFRVFGVDHDQAPAEYNRHLAKVEIRGAVSDTANHLDFSDSDQCVTATVALPEGPAVGKWLDLYWGDREDPVASYTVKSDDKPGQLVTFTGVPWEIVAETPNNPAFPVSYRTSNGVNEQLAPNQFVNINIVPPVRFPRPEFAHASTTGWLNCQTDPPIWEGVHVHVNKHAAIAVGDELRLKWQGTWGFAGDRPIAETSEVFKEDWLDVDESQGYHVFVVPYIPYVQPMKNEAGAYAEFTVWRNGTRIGSSSIRYVKIDRRYSTSDPVFCGPNGNGPD
ncbi:MULTISPECIES: hypothetical protein [Pseudomonas]|uniref:hypothetical protein n=2 Tax=Pseudomonas TaxID=286 RepID=UPI0018E62B0C|nr:MULTISPECIES: hypothetical protein [Pseudomonas]MBI6657041.1 hypothetical protein [Pseudomonas carnis]MBK3478799.1 hypothetical protein [Pseudomonas sp. MF6751]MBL4981306.1 hypothetical protein [Pseudomonas fluorescens]MBY8954083.1 hypothetical protein [Pseudomonas carnis]